MKTDFQKIEETFELTSKETLVVLLKSFQSALLPFFFRHYDFWHVPSGS